MAEKQSSVVLNFETKGQIQYAKTIKDINAIMNAAAKEYRSQIKAMGDDATATDKLRAEKKKLETQMEAGRERTKKLREEFLKMQENSKTTTSQLNNMYGKLKDSESAEAALEAQLTKVNAGLSEQAEASRKNKSELAGLQQESLELESQTEKLNSELKLQESTMGDTAAEAEKAGFAQEKFAKQSELAEKQISNLEKQLELVKSEFGENSIEANKMETELNDAKTAFNNLNNEMHETKSSADVAQNGMGRVTQLLQSQVYMEAAQQLSQISDKLIEMGKDSIQVAADFQASEAQFSQVFGNMEDEAKNMVASMGEQMGILPRRLEPGYAAISSQLMSLGVEQEKAMELAEQALISSADAAAFYDLSLEDAQERVQSFIKGNMNAAEAIGIFATAGGMATYAIQNGFIEATAEQEQFANKMEISIEKAQKKMSDAQAKYGADSLEARDATQKLNEELEKQEKGLNLTSKWNELSEAQKQAVRVDYIENMQKMGEVTGQATREMDGYENVMGNLDSSIDEIKNALGEELLAMVLEVAQVAIPMLSGFAEWFKNLSPVIKQFVVAFGAVIVVVGALLPLIATLALGAAAAGVTIGAFIVGTILPAIGIIAGIAAAIAGVILVFKNWGEITDWLSEKWQQFTAFFKEMFSDILKSLAEFFTKQKESWNTFWSEIFQKVSEIKDMIVGKIVELKDGIVNKFIEIKDGAIEIWNQIIEVLAPIVQKIFDIIMVPVSLIKTLLYAVWLYIKAGLDIASAYFMQIFTAISDWFAKKGEEFKAMASEIFQAFKKNIIDPVNEAKDEVIAKVVELWQSIVEKFNGIKNATKEKWQEIKDMLVGKFTEAKDAATGVVAELWSKVTSKYDEIYNGTKEKFKKIKDAIIEPVVQAKDKIKEVIESIKDFFFNIKLPKFGLKTSTKTIAGKEISFPSGIDVKWNAKGGIFNQPTIFGTSGGKLQGAGEAGPEAVLPLTEENLAAIGRGIPGNGNNEVNIHIGKVDANNPSELDRINRNIEQAGRLAAYELGGDFA